MDHPSSADYAHARANDAIEAAGQVRHDLDGLLERFDILLGTCMEMAQRQENFIQRIQALEARGRIDAQINARLMSLEEPMLDRQIDDLRKQLSQMDERVEALVQLVELQDEKLHKHVHGITGKAVVP